MPLPLAHGRAVLACAIALLVGSLVLYSITSSNAATQGSSATLAPDEASPPAAPADSGAVSRSASGAVASPQRSARAAPEEETAESAASAPAAAPTPTPTPPPSLLAVNQVVVYYGSPVAAGLGVLGRYNPDGAADAVRGHAARFDELNGDKGAIPAFDLIFGLAQDQPTDTGLYVRDLPDDVVDRYIDAADRHNLQLILDLQIGRDDIVQAVRKIERFLLNPRVHVAVDPEYAVGPDGVPGTVAGHISGAQINEIQQYLAALVRDHHLPPKIFVVHQFLEETVTEPDTVAHVDGVEFVLNMDAYGDTREKERKYRMFSAKPHSKNNGYNVFFLHDYEVLTDEQILALSPVPSVIFFQ